MKQFIIITTSFLVLAIVIWLGLFYWNNLRGVWPVVLDSDKDIVDELDNQDKPGDNKTDFPLALPDGFSISIFAKDLPGARVIIQDSLGNFWASQPKQGQVSLLTVENNEVTSHNAVFRNLNNPHGLAFDPQNGFDLYIAEEDKISRARTYSEGGMEKIADLPTGGRHTTRTIAFGPDDKLYVSIGSACDVCVEDNDMRGTIYRMDKDGSNFEQYAIGLRNTVFFTWDYVFGNMYGTDMGRDMLGDNLPPDEINVIEQGKDYGWPYCYGQNMHDTEFDKNQYIRNPCEDKAPSLIDIPAHSAPLGLAFVPEEAPNQNEFGTGYSWPEDYWYDLIVAYHGSWNRTEPTGYKLVRHKFRADRDELVYEGVEDFITGWLDGNTSLGRPVAVLIQPGGVMYITDDKAGVVYKVTHKDE